AVLCVIIAWVLAGTYQSLVSSGNELSWRKVDTAVPLDEEDFKTKEMGLRFLIKFAENQHKGTPPVLSEKWAKLGHFYERQQLYPQAIDAFKNALNYGNIADTAQGLPAAQRMGDLAEAYYLDGQYKLAEPLFQQKIAIVSTNLEPTSLYTALP